MTLTFDLLTLKAVCELRVTWATSVPILVFLGFSILDLGLMYAIDRRRKAGVRQHHCLMPPPRSEGIKTVPFVPVYLIAEQSAANSVMFKVSTILVNVRNNH